MIGNSPHSRTLQRVKDKLTFITGLDRTFQEGTDVHSVPPAS